eukprot:24593-Pyramimonas_sp.AAC.1
MIGATMPNMMHAGDGSSSTTVAGRTALPSSLVQQLVAMSAAAGQRTEQGYATPPTATHEDVFQSPESQRGPADAMITIATNQLEVANQRLEAAVRMPVDGTVRNAPQRETNEEHCIICLEREVTTKAMPCGHTHFCLDCAGLIYNGA